MCIWEKNLFFSTWYGTEGQCGPLTCLVFWSFLGMICFGNGVPGKIRWARKYFKYLVFVLNSMAVIFLADKYSDWFMSLFHYLCHMRVKDIANGENLGVSQQTPSFLLLPGTAGLNFSSLGVLETTTSRYYWTHYTWKWYHCGFWAFPISVGECGSLGGRLRVRSVQQPMRQVLSISVMRRKAGTVGTTGFGVQEWGRNHIGLQ